MRFALLGAAGYVAKKHLAAIKHVGGDLVACMDPHDSVGVLDAYFPDCRYFREFEPFDRFIEHSQRNHEPVEWLAIASPNYLHESQTRWGLRMGMNVICEKPLVLNPDNLDAIAEIERETGKRVFCVLQLRYHPDLAKIPHDAKEADVVYHAIRGRWYGSSWKADESKSGGLLMNIGIHYFDLILRLFGPAVESECYYYGDAYKGKLVCERGTADWQFSIREGPCRRLKIGGQSIDLSEALRDLHNVVYEKAMQGEGAGIEDCRPALELVREMTGGRSAGRGHGGGMTYRVVPAKDEP